MLPMKKTATFIEIVDALPHHVSALRATLRAEDAQEILRFGISIEKALWRSYRNSTYRKSVLIDGDVVAMFGVQGGFLANEGLIWLLTGEGVNRVSPLRFCRIYQSQVEAMLEIFTYLYNYVDAQHGAAIRLLENSGFTVYDAEKFGFAGNLYRKFEIGK